MRIIAHRGLIDGPDKNIENKIAQLKLALSKGYDIEFDLRYGYTDEGKPALYLGHDHCQEEFNVEVINVLASEYPKQTFWIHCKDIRTLREIHRVFHALNKRNIDYFFHDSDDVTLTNKGYFWTYPDKDLTPFSVHVLPESKCTPSQFKDNFNPEVGKKKEEEYNRRCGTKYNFEQPYAICTDYARLMDKAIKEVK